MLTKQPDSSPLESGVLGLLASELWSVFHVVSWCWWQEEKLVRYGEQQEWQRTNVKA